MGQLWWCQTSFPVNTFVFQNCVHLLSPIFFFVIVIFFCGTNVPQAHIWSYITNNACTEHNDAPILTNGLCSGWAWRREVLCEVHITHVAAAAAEMVRPILDLWREVGHYAAIFAATLVVTQVSPATWQWEGYSRLIIFTSYQLNIYFYIQIIQFLNPSHLYFHGFN